MPSRMRCASASQITCTPLVGPTWGWGVLGGLGLGLGVGGGVGVGVEGGRLRWGFEVVGEMLNLHCRRRSVEPGKLHSITPSPAQPITTLPPPPPTTTPHTHTHLHLHVVGGDGPPDGVLGRVERHRGLVGGATLTECRLEGEVVAVVGQVGCVGEFGSAVGGWGVEVGGLGVGGEDERQHAGESRDSVFTRPLGVHFCNSTPTSQASDPRA